MLIEAFEKQVKKRCDRLAVKAGEYTLTYGFLDEYASRLADVLTRTGRALDRQISAALLLGHDERMIIAIIGALKSGIVYIPFDPTYPEDRLTYMLKDSAAGCIVTDKNNLPLAVKLNKNIDNRAAVINLEELDEPAIPLSEVETPSTETMHRLTGGTAYILYTSGSTGKPKGVIQERGNIFYFIESWTGVFSVSETDRLAQFASFCHDGSIPDIYSALLNGAALYLFDIKQRADIEAPARWLIKEKISIWHSVPTWYRYFVNSLTGDGDEDFPDLRLVILGGEQVREHDIMMYQKYFPHSRFGNIYGQSESTVSSIWLLSPGDDYREILIGNPIQRTEIFVVDSEGDEVNELEVGEIVIAADYLSPGYLNNGEATHKVYSRDQGLGRLYWSGDLGRLLPGGNIEILGRKDHQVKVRGFRIEPGEIETLLLQHPDIGEVVVIARESTGGSTYGMVSQDNYLWAYFVARRNFKVTELREYLAGKLPDYMIPGYFVQLEFMPVTPTGKIDRNSLPAQGTRLSTGTPYAPPENETEKLLTETWKKVLEIDQIQIGIDDNFFDLGGSSMDLIALINRLKKTFKREIPVIAVFRYLTIRSFAGYLTRPGEQTRDLEKDVDRTDEIKRSWERAGERKKQADQAGAAGEKETGPTGWEIAVIGMDGRFPGAKNLEEFWENIKNGVDCITFFSEKELEEAGVPAQLLQNPDYVKAQPLLADIENFDASFFDYTAGEAAVMDPQMRIFHECVYHALEDAGYNPFSYEKLIGVYAGASVSFYWMAYHFLAQARDDAGLFEARQLFDKEYLCTRVAHKLNLRGPAVSVQTSCSTSLVAIHTACRALINGECDTALAGGVSIPYLKKEGHLFHKASIFSSDGHCKVFDARADGTIFGSGVGVVVLKRLEEAVAERDHIYAVIKGSFINNDGLYRGGYTAPAVEGEAAAIRTALQTAAVEPESIGYVETHSTGTVLGGPIEFAALELAFDTQNKGFCALGCVKTNVGHLNIAAGVAGFIKTVLALKHQLLPPNLHFETPDPVIDFENSPFYVNTQLTRWEKKHYPRRAGINSFGIGGTNAHIILEEFPPQEKSIECPPVKSRDYRLILLSAKTPAILDKVTENLTLYLKENPGVNLSDVEYTLMVGRRACACRRMLVCSHVEEAIRKLTANQPGKTHTAFARKENNPVIFMFPGLGAQYVDMGRGLYEQEPIFREEMNRCFEILKPLLDYDIKEILYPSAAGHRSNRSYKSYIPQINQFEIAQVVVFIFEYSLAALLMAWGIRPYALIGYSFGEYTAACISGVLSLPDALKLIVIRGELINRLPAGSMLSVPLDRERLESLLVPHPGLSLAIDNGLSCIVSGPVQSVAAFEKEMTKMKQICMRIPSGRALHSPMMEPILEEFTEKIARDITLNKPRIPYISNVTGNWITPGEITQPVYWARHLSKPVRFSGGIDLLMKQENAVFLEIGPGRDLTTLLDRHIKDKPGIKAINSTRHREQDTEDLYLLLNRLGHLWLQGIPIDWNRFFAHETKYRVSLPGYPFEHRAFPAVIDFNEKFADIFSLHFLPSQPPLPPEPGSLPGEIAAAGVIDNPGQVSRRPVLETVYTGPRNEIEQRMVRIWAQFFGFEPIGIEDDFFELGGDSLKALIVLDKIQEELGIELSMNEFFKQRTIGNLAASIIAKVQVKQSLFDLVAEVTPWAAGPKKGIEPANLREELERLIQQPLVLLNGGKEDLTQKKIFCFPPALAHGRVYTPLAVALTGYSFYSFNFIENGDRLREYVEMIARSQPGGPYLLLEYSAGMKLTFEVAKALEKDGGEISDIILMDSFWPGKPMDARVPERVIENMEQYLEELGVGYLKEKILTKVRKYREYFTEETRPGKVNANIHLILAEENRSTPQARCWEPFTTKSLRIYQGYGRHDEMLHPGAVEKNAKIIKGILAKCNN